MRPRVGRANRNVVGGHTQIVKPLLNGDAHSAAAAPQPDEKIWPKSTLIYGNRQSKRIEQQVVGRNEALFVHVPLSAYLV